MRAITHSHRHGMSCRMENVVGRSVHLTPSGIDFDEHVFQLGQGTVVRAAGSLIFPRYPFVCFSQAHIASSIFQFKVSCTSDICACNNLKQKVLWEQAGSNTETAAMPFCIYIVLQISSGLDARLAGSCRSRKERDL